MGGAGSACRSDGNVKTAKEKSKSTQNKKENKSKQKTEKHVEATPVEDVRPSSTVRGGFCESVLSHMSVEDVTH